jgi:translation elongation factor EF-Ts
MMDEQCQSCKEMRAQNQAMMDVHNALVKEHGDATRQLANLVPALKATIERLKLDIVLIHQVCTHRQRYKLRRVLWLDQQEIENCRKYLHPEYMYGHGKKRKTA